jgi:RNA polymerase sigma factor (sigma-70 family)
MSDSTDRYQNRRHSDTVISNGSALHANLTAGCVADFISQHQGELSRFIIRKLGSEEHASDILQDAYLRMTSRQTTEPVENTRAFVFRIVANLIIDFQRRSVNRMSHEADEEVWENIHENLPGPEIRYQHLQRLEAISLALEALSEPCRLAFYLNRIEGHSHIEIAMRWQISESMFAKHLARAMKHCRDRLRHF